MIWFKEPTALRSEFGPLEFGTIKLARDDVNCNDLSASMSISRGGALSSQMLLSF